MRHTRGLLVVQATMLLVLTPFKAPQCQQASSLRAGDRVRLTVAPPPTPRVQGRIVSLSQTALVLGAPASSDPVAFSSISLLEVRRKTAGSFFRSVAYGLLIGVGGGVVAGAARGDVDTGDGRISAAANALIGAVIGGMAGLVGGTVYGACCASNWQAIAIPRSN
jgi:hypothetical protein